MKFELTPSQRGWRDEVRAFLAWHFTPDVEAEAAESSFKDEPPGPLVREFHKKVSEQGWWGLNWPKEYGGLAKSAVEKLIFSEEFEYAGAPFMSRTIASSIGPAILAVGTEQNKRTWVPRIIRGEIEFALGYSEPDAGTDLANLKTRAELIGDEWVINGQKIWNSLAHYATHEWLAVRTDPDLPRHKGISIIIVPLDSPGITVQPLWTWPGMRTNQTFFDNVRVPKENLVGEINGGWTAGMTALALKRSGAYESAGSFRRLLDDLVDYCKNSTFDGEVVARRPFVALRLTELAMQVEVVRLLGYRVAAIIDSGHIPDAEASIVKVFGSELRTKLADWGMQVLGLYGQLRGGDELAPLRGRLEHAYRLAPVGRFGGGTNEVQRDIVAQRGFGLPRMR